MNQSIIISGLIGGVVGAVVISNLNQKMLLEKDRKIDKFKSYYHMVNQWLAIKQNGKRLTDYLETKGYKTIAIYGLGEMGRSLINELEKSKIEIAYGLDKVIGNSFDSIKTYLLDEIEDIKEDVDVVIVTAIFAFDEIYNNIVDNFNCPIISLEDIIYDVD